MNNYGLPLFIFLKLSKMLPLPPKSDILQIFQHYAYVVQRVWIMINPLGLNESLGASSDL